MAKLGIAKTNKFSIGTAEIRIGPLSLANKLTQAHSIGLLDDVTLEVSQESVDLLGGFPRATVDTAVVSQASNLTATLREYSRRNIRVMLGEGVSGSEPSDAATTLSGSATSGATTLALTASIGSAGDLLVIYPIGSPAEVSVCRITTAGTSTTLDSDTPILHDYSAGAIVYVANHVPIGNIQQTNYFSVQMIQQERSTGRPIGFNFWKATIGSGMSMATNAEDFASSELQIKVVEPSVNEYLDGGTGDLEHLSAIIPLNPTGMAFLGGDS